MISALSKQGGLHTEADFAGAQSFATTPVRGDYKGHDLWEHPPNGQGATAILILNILKHFDLEKLDPLGADRLHLEIEAAKLAYDARNRFIADPDHMNRLDDFLSADKAAALASLIDPERAMGDPTALSESVHRDTIYITVVDRDRMAVSLIYSIFSSFGSGIASEKYGILFQNRGSGFNLIPGHPNELAGGKRPMHTIIPGMLAKDGKPIMPFGVMGGQYQPHGHARVLTNMLDYGMDPQTAIDQPRAFYEKGVVNIETGYDASVVAEMMEKGHKVADPETPIGGAQAIMIHDSGVLEGGSDPRKDGCAIGY